MSKYIIEIKPEYEDSFKVLMILGAKDSNLFFDTLAVDDLEQLSSDYINEHYGSLQEEAYQKGLHDGAPKCRYCNLYQCGLDDAWEAARKIVKMPDPPYWGVFDEYKDDLFRKITAAEAIAKLKAYEEKQKADDEIKVGDEVADKDGDKTIVTNIHGDLFDGLCSDGSTMTDLFLDDNHKTGRHFDIDKILKEMKGDNNK